MPVAARKTKGAAGTRKLKDAVKPGRKAAAGTAANRPAVTREAIDEAVRAIRLQAEQTLSLTEAQSEVFAAMLAEMDNRIDDIVARTDRLMARQGQA